MARRSADRRRAAARPPKRPSWWATLAGAAVQAGVRGHQQWALIRLLEALGCGRWAHRGIFVTRRELARRLELEADARWDGRNTGRREHRLEQLGLLTIVVGGGRLPGCDRKRWRGRANRIYPGPLLCPQVLVRRQIEADDAAEAGRAQLDGPPPAPAAPAPQPSRGEQLAAEYRRRGRARAPSPP